MAALAACSAAAGAEPVSGDRDLALVLRRSITSTSREFEQTVAALRQLRDPKLKPVFAQLAAGEGIERRIQGMLGLAELESPPALEPLLVGQLKDPGDQLKLLAIAFEQGLLPAERARALLARPDLPSIVEVYLLAVASSGGPAAGAAERVARLLEDGNEGVRATAAALALQAGEHPAAAPVLEALLADATPDGLERLRLTVRDVKMLRAAAAKKFLVDIAARCESPGIRADAIAALLEIAPADGAEAWLAEWAKTGELAGRLRLALGAVEAGPKASASIVGAMSKVQGQPLLVALAKAAAWSRQENPAVGLPLIELIASRHAPSIAWALGASSRLPKEEAAEVRAAAVSLVAGRVSPSTPIADEAVRAAALLADENTQTLADMLGSTGVSDERVRLTLLLGALRAKTTLASEALAGRQVEGSESRALLAIVQARADRRLSPTETEDLRLASTGWGGLSLARRMQATWLLLRHAGQDRAAIAVVLSPASD